MIAKSRRFPFGQRLQRHIETGLIGGAETGGSSYGNRDPSHVGVLRDNRVDLFLKILKRVEGNFGRRPSGADDKAASPCGTSAPGKVLNNNTLRTTDVSVIATIRTR